MATLNGEPISIHPFPDDDLARTFGPLKKWTERGQITDAEYHVTLKRTREVVRTHLPEIDFDN